MCILNQMEILHEIDLFNKNRKLDIKNNILYRKELWEQNPCNPNYWLDFNEATPNNDGTFTIVCRPVKIPYVNIIEMFCDFIGAGQSYEKEK